MVLANVEKLLNFLLNRSSTSAAPSLESNALLVREMLPLLPTVAQELLPEVSRRLATRVGARVIRELYI